MSNCSNCGKEKEKTPETIPYIAHESAMARAERAAKRLWIVIILLIVMLVATNGAWIWYESQFETVETVEEYQIEQDTEGGGNNNSIIDGGEVVDGKPEN